MRLFSVNKNTLSRNYKTPYYDKSTMPWQEHSSLEIFIGEISPIKNYATNNFIAKNENTRHAFKKR